LASRAWSDQHGNDWRNALFIDQVVEHWRHEGPIRSRNPLFSADVRLAILHHDERCRSVRYIPGRNVDGDLTLEHLLLWRFRLQGAAPGASGGRGWENLAFS